MLRLKSNASPEVIRKYESFKRPYAYDKFGNKWNLPDALNVDNREYFLDPKCKIPLINRFKATKIPKHWAIKPKVEFEYHGKKLNTSNLIDESPEHLEMKRKIIDNGYFFWKGYKIFIEDTSEEFVFYDSQRFRADVKGSMLDGTPILVEVVKTSEVSKRKENFINKHEFTTFVIYIDKDGNQINDKFNSIGNKQIEELTERIQNGEGKIADLRIRIEEEESRIIHTQRELEKRPRKDFSDAVEIEVKWDYERYWESVQETKRIEEQLFDKEEQLFDKFERIKTKLQRKINRIKNESERSFGDVREKIRNTQQSITETKTDFCNASKYILEDIKNIRSIQNRIRNGNKKIQEVSKRIKFSKI